MHIYAETIRAYYSRSCDTEGCEGTTTCANANQRQAGYYYRKVRYGVVVASRRYYTRVILAISGRPHVNYDDRKRLDLSVERFRAKGLRLSRSRFSRRFRDSVARCDISGCVELYPRFHLSRNSIHVLLTLDASRSIRKFMAFERSFVFTNPIPRLVSRNISALVVAEF